jgi:restriction system protein
MVTGVEPAQPQTSPSNGAGVPSGSAPTTAPTIVDAIRTVMQHHGAAMTAEAVYRAIVDRHLYEFKADNPSHVVRSQIRRHCLGLDFPSASRLKVFELRPDGRYFYLAAPTTTDRQRRRRATTDQNHPTPATEVRAAHERFVRAFKVRVLRAVNDLQTREFEHFCRNLIRLYGFHDVVVTNIGRDGGIDGHGRLTMGLTSFNVAFQCKKWRHANVGRPEVNQFRGDIQGKYEQGIFFTTARFTSEAQHSGVQPGAVTIVLMDGPAIVDKMLEKGFGVEKVTLELYNLDLEQAIQE